jgi:phosphoglycerate dehydrogenase-like enzyme
MEKNMPGPEILVSHDFEPKHRKIFTEMIGDSAGIIFLSDVSKKDRADVLSRVEIVISWNPSKEFGREEFRLLVSVRLIQLLTAGANHAPLDSLPHGALIASVPGAYAEPMAEHILGMILALAKRLCVCHAKLRDGEFDQSTRNRMLHGLTCGVLGFGGIGQAASKLLRAFNVKVFAINTSGRTSEPVDFIGTLDALDFVLERSDIILVSLPLTLRTKGLISGRELDLMKPDAILINAARGAIVDQHALYNRLVKFPDFRAGIDTWWAEPETSGEFRVDFPFFSLPNFLGSPHNSAVVPGIMQTAIRKAVENVIRFMGGEDIRGMIKRGDYVQGWAE